MVNGPEVLLDDHAGIVLMAVLECPELANRIKESTSKRVQDYNGVWLDDRDGLFSPFNILGMIVTNSSSKVYVDHGCVSRSSRLYGRSSSSGCVSSYSMRARAHQHTLA